MAPRAKINQPAEPVIVEKCRKSLLLWAFLQRKTAHQPDNELYQYCCAVIIGVGRLELPASWSRTKRATSCATPRQTSLFIIISLSQKVKQKCKVTATARRIMEYIYYDA